MTSRNYPGRQFAVYGSRIEERRNPEDGLRTDSWESSSRLLRLETGESGGDADAESGTGAAGTDAGAHAYAALMAMDDVPRQREAEAVALALGGEEGLEDGVDVLVRNAAAVVGDGEVDTAIATTHAEMQRAIGGEGVEGVDD